MLSISKKKYLKSLYNKKFRLIENKTLIEGVRVINEALKTGFKFDHIWIDEKFNSNLNPVISPVLEIVET